MKADAIDGVAEGSGQSEHWYQCLFDANPLPMLIYEQSSFKVLKINDSTIQHYGYSAAEWMHMSAMDLYLREDVPAVVDASNSARKNDFHYTGSWRHLTKDRMQLEVDVFQCIISFHGRAAVLAIFRDMTALHRAEQDLNQTQRIARLGSWVMDLPENRIRWSDQEYRNFGLQPHSIAPTYEHFLDLVHHEDREMVAQHLSQALSGAKPYECDYRVIWPDGSTHVLREQGILVSENNGERRQFIGTSLEVTEQKSIEDQLLQTKADLNKAQQIARCGTWIWEVGDDHYITTSAETLQLLGLPPDEARITSDMLLQRIHPDDRERIRLARSTAIADPSGHYDVEYRVLHADGSELNIHSMAEISFDAQGRPVRMVGFLQDVTEKKRAEERIRQLAFYDDVTGVPNRLLLRQELDNVLTASHSATHSIALLNVSLSRLRDINYTLGHVNGDILLKEVCARVCRLLKPKDMGARIGNAQFAIVLPDATAEEATTRIREILRALEEPFSIAGITYGLGAHIGIALAPGHGKDADTLLRKSDVALYQAKQSGQIYVFYNPSQDPYNPRRLTLMGEFRNAVNAGELQLYCQPKANIRSGEIIGAEALVRWQHPKFGLISPDQFISLIEPTEMIHSLTDCMLHAAAKQCYSWQEQGFHIPLAVNLSARNLSDPGLDTKLKYLLLTWGVNADWLGLEITESSLMADPAASIEGLNRLRRMGFRLFVDDFGTGYSSLSYLAKLPINVIKIDHGFTMHMLKDKGAATIVKSTIELAHNLGMSVVAEGTASREIWNALAELDCDEAQGYFISPPLPAKDFIPSLQTSNFHFSNIPDQRLH